MEPVRELQGVLYINDSKATNPHATASAVRGLRRPVVLIAGGQAKGADFSCLGQALQGRLRAAVLLGEAAEGLAQALRPLCPVHVVADMAQAVHAARALAQEGDVVLLSPACASFDMFQGYEHRGRVFSQEVLRL
jgi:UDP-N-acetylmuramoylalanine--D-glutamate ligase